MTILRTRCCAILRAVRQQASGPVVELPPAVRRLSGTLAVLPESSSWGRYEDDPRLALNGVSPVRAEPGTRGSTGRRTARPPAGRRRFDDRAR
ncbi:hypothetical protein ACWC9Q_10065 [Streptomyces sp. NPDC001142]